MSKLVVDVLISLVLGTLIGFFSPKNLAVALMFSVVVSTGFLVFLQWSSGTLSREWSLTDPVASAIYLVGPFILFYFLPVAFMALLIVYLRK
jgi:hypothetical protein